MAGTTFRSPTQVSESSVIDQAVDESIGLDGAHSVPYPVIPPILG